ncbi:hypothetical protein HBI24_202760 [Parastagonospora nodorum]|nr:hypothetical protein HBI24_202760 [Parastagonospora nodorum]
MYCCCPSSPFLSSCPVIGNIGCAQPCMTENTIVSEKRPSAVAVQCTKCNASLHLQIKETVGEGGDCEESRPCAGGQVIKQNAEMWCLS